MFSGMGRPGQRVSSTQGMTTEVQIPVVQWLVSVGALLLVALIIQRLVVVPVGDWYLAAHPTKFVAVVGVQNIVFNVMFIFALVFPTFYLGMSMLTNVINPNLPAPMAAQDPNDVKLPAVVRVAMGYGAALPWPLSAFAKVLSATRRDEPSAQPQNSPIPAVAIEPCAVTLEWNDGGNERAKRRATVALYADEWAGLATLAADDRHFSTRELATVLGDPRAREVLTALRAARLVESTGKSTTAITPLMAWLKANGSKSLHLGDNGLTTI